MDCIIRTLKTSVDNNNLPVYGELKLKIKKSSQLLRIYARAPTEANCFVSGTDGFIFKNITQEPTYTNPFQLMPSMTEGFYLLPSQDGYMVFSNKYELGTTATNKSFGFYNVEDVDGGFDSIIIPSDTKFFIFRDATMYLDIKEIGNKLQNIDDIEKIDLGYTQLGESIFGNIAYFAISGLKNIDISGCKNVTGDIASLGAITTLTNIAVRDSKVYGTIESFVAAQRTAGRTTGSVSGNSAGWGNVTFNGSTTNAKGAVSWTATTITMNGVTIDA